MIIHFLRHGPAERFSNEIHQQDSDRHLTPEGCEKMKAAAEGFLKSGIKFDQIISSPYHRALETAKIVSEVYHHDQDIAISEFLTPEALFHKFRSEFLEKWSHLSSVLVVTHQPFVGEAISILMTGREEPFLAMNMGTGSLCSLEIESHWSSPALLLSMTSSAQAAWLAAQ